MKHVEFDEVIAEAVAIIGAAGDDEVAKNFARQFAWRALQSLGTTDDSIQVTEITAKNLLLRKPKNLKKLVEIALFDSSDNFIQHKFHQGNSRIYPNIDSYSYNVVLNEGEDDEETVTYSAPVDLSENETSYVIGTNGSQVSYALVRYYPYPLDANSLPLVREDEVEAITAYVRWKWSQRKNENQSEIVNNERVWKQAADWCVAHKKSSDFSNEVRKRIAASLNRMLPNFNRSQF